MFRLIKSIVHFFRSSSNNCSPICPHCEVEVSERTALAISKVLYRRMKQVSENNALVDELKLQREEILKGSWHQEYETLTK